VLIVDPLFSVVRPTYNHGLLHNLLSDTTYFVYRAVTFFNKIIKATYVRSKAAYRLKIIARARSINNRFLALIYILVTTL